jgi:hypothetical protein
MKFNKHPQLNTGVRNLCAAAAISITLPALAYADRDNDKDGRGRGDNDKHQERGGPGLGDPRVTSTPEPNTAIVLIPFLGAVLVVGSMHLWRRQKNASI